IADADIPFKMDLGAFFDQPTSSKPLKFFYLDPNGKEYGPCTREAMDAWYSKGCFKDDVKIRRECDSSFTELGELRKKHGENPFDSMSRSKLETTSPQITAMESTMSTDPIAAGESHELVETFMKYLRDYLTYLKTNQPV
ncbi:hypothetical protein PMAYCL1PPCAC_03223, partial [Pristionchus mayeri]